MRNLLLFISLLTNGGALVEYKIYGSKNVDNFQDYNFMVSIEEDNGNPLCGGVIIEKKSILTTAHCFCNLTVNVTIYLKYGNRNRYEMKSMTIKNTDRHIIKPKNYDCKRLDNDIALLKTDTSFPNTTRIMNTTDSKIIDGTICTILGWGKTIHQPDPNTEEDSVYLMNFNVSANNSESCIKANINISENMLCSKFSNEGEYRGAAKGDSGGPLLCNGKLAGLISWFDNETNITAYTKVGNYDLNNPLQLDPFQERKEDDNSSQIGYQSNIFKVFSGVMVIILVYGLYNA